MKDILTVIIVILLGLWLAGFAYSEIKDGEYDLCLMTLNMDKIACTMDINEKFIVEDGTWNIGGITGTIEDKGAYAKLYLGCGFSPCVDTFIGYYSYIGDGWTADLKTRIILLQDPFDIDSWCEFSPAIGCF